MCGVFALRCARRRSVRGGAGRGVSRCGRGVTVRVGALAGRRGRAGRRDVGVSGEMSWAWRLVSSRLGSRRRAGMSRCGRGCVVMGVAAGDAARRGVRCAAPRRGAARWARDAQSVDGSVRMVDAADGVKRDGRDAVPTDDSRCAAWFGSWTRVVVCAVASRPLRVQPPACRDAMCCPGSFRRRGAASGSTRIAAVSARCVRGESRRGDAFPFSQVCSPRTVCPCLWSCSVLC